jgi:hypothetical protein
MQEIKDIIEIKEKRKLLDIYYELQNSDLDQLFLQVDEKGDVYIQYAKYRKKSL